MNDPNNRPKWSTLPEADLPVIKDLIALLESTESESGMPDNSFFKDKSKINELIEGLILVHRKAGLDSPLLKFKRDEKRKQLFKDDDPDWEKKLKRALGEASLIGAITPALPVKSALPSLLKVEGPVAEKLKLLNPNEFVPPEDTSTKWKFMLLYIISGLALALSIIAMVRR